MMMMEVKESHYQKRRREKVLILSWLKRVSRTAKCNVLGDRIPNLKRN